MCRTRFKATTALVPQSCRWSCGECASCSSCAARGEGWAARCAGACASFAHAHCARLPWRCAACQRAMPHKKYARPRPVASRGLKSPANARSVCRSAPGLAPKGRKPKPSRHADSDDEPSDGNATPAPAALARLPVEQRMSKEKQKFFRFSAFNLVKRRRRRSSAEWEGWDARARWGKLRVTRVQRLELRLQPSEPGSSSSPSPPPSPSRPGRAAFLPAAPVAPHHISTVFERLAADAAPGGAWGFAAEAQKQRPPARPAQQPRPPERPAQRPPEDASRSRATRRRSRCSDRLLTTLFDGLSEFYSVRTASRSQSRHRPAPPVREDEEDRQVLKETRSTFRRYQASLRRERSGSRARGSARPKVESRERSPSRPRFNLRDRSRSRPPEPSRARARSRSRPRTDSTSGEPVEAPRLSASQLVRSAAAGKLLGACGAADADKLCRGLALSGGGGGGRPATNQTGKMGS